MTFVITKLYQMFENDICETKLYQMSRNDPNTEIFKVYSIWSNQMSACFCVKIDKFLH